MNSNVFVFFPKVVSDCPVGGKTDKPGKCCAFPFQYKKVSYDSCTKVNHDKLWCSLTANYDTDRQWANCGKEKGEC